MATPSDNAQLHSIGTSSEIGNIVVTSMGGTRNSLMSARANNRERDFDVG